MKKCKGCGVELQRVDENLPGYVLNDEQDYCQRCFRLIHYGDIKKLKQEKVNNIEIFKLYQNFKKACFILIVDCFDALILDKDNLLSIYKDYPLILVLNKIDLLPRNMKDEKMEDIFSNLLSSVPNSNIVNCLLSYKGDSSFNELFFETIKKLPYKEYVFVGRANAGKSTIINKLLQNNDLTVSTYPGTTINTNIIEYEDYKFVDTPGLIDEESFASYIDKSHIKELLPSKCVKPKIFQFYEPVSYSIKGLVDIELKPKKLSTLALYINNDLDVHRTSLNNIDNYLEKHNKEFKLKLMPFKSNQFMINNKQTIYLKGLGYLKINGSTSCNIRVNEKIKLYKCEVNL